MKRVLITGGSGFVGANLTRHLLERGHDLHLLVRTGHNNWRIRSILNELHLHQCSLDDLENLEQIVQVIRPDWIFHLAVYGAYPSQTNFHVMLDTNLGGLANLIQTCLRTGFESFINAGSSSEYGIQDHAPAETESPQPNSDYAITKVSATMYCDQIARSRNVNIKTLRLYSVYGPYEEPSRFIPRLIVHGLQGQYPPLVDPKIGRDFVHVCDVCNAFELSTASVHNKQNSIYNVGTGKQNTIGEAVEIVRRHLNIKEEPQWGSMTSRSWDTRTWVADPNKIMHDIKWKPQFDLDQGIGDMFQWFNKNPEVLAYYRNVSDNLPK